MSRMIFKKGIVLFIFPDRTYALDFFRVAILTYILIICFLKYDVLAYFLSNCLERMFRSSQIIILTLYRYKEGVLRNYN